MSARPSTIELEAEAQRIIDTEAGAETQARMEAILRELYSRDRADVGRRILAAAGGWAAHLPNPPAEAETECASPQPDPIETTLGALAAEYGVECPAGGEAVAVTLLRRESGAWGIAPSVSEWSGLTDAEWAPRDDAHAEELRTNLAAAERAEWARALVEAEIATAIDGAACQPMPYSNPVHEIQWTDSYINECVRAAMRARDLDPEDEGEALRWAAALRAAIAE